jgi:hypothetical protein
MQTHDQKSEIATLEIQLADYQKLLDRSIEENEEFAKTKAIFHDLKMIKDRLDKLKGVSDDN